MQKLDAIDYLFHPQSIAILGASKEPDKPGGKCLQNFLNRRFQGQIYPINPNSTQIGELQTYDSIMDVPGEVEAAIIALPVRRLKEAVEECAKKKVKTVVIFTAGVGEIGGEGKQLQNELVEIANKHQMRLVGPNCFGVVNLLNGMLGCFASIFRDDNLRIGSGALVSQSGGIGLNLVNHSFFEGIGFNYWVSTGNEADLDFSDFVSYLIERPEVKVVGGYIENIKDGKKFIDAAKKAFELKKPLVALKVGTTGIGERAIMSHTGSLAGNDAIYDTLFRQHGVIRVKDKTELLDTMKIFEMNKKPKGKRVGIITTSGGNGVMFADQAIECGLEVPSPSPDIQEKMKHTLSPFASTSNPIDVTTQVNKEMFKECIKLAIEDPNFDTVIISSSTINKYLQDFLEIIKNTEKLVCVVSTHIAPQARELAIRHQIPYFEDITRCVKALSNIVKFELNIRKADTPALEIKRDERNLKVSFPDVEGIMEEWRAKKMLSGIIAVPKGELALTAEEAVQSLRRIGYPVVMKISSNTVAHKTNIGGVKVNLKDEQDVIQAYHEIKKNVAPHINFEGVLIEEFIKDKGIEIVVGFNRDPVFGHFLTFGLGGIFVEVLRDVSMRLLPVTYKDIQEMMKEIKGWALLSGYRQKITYDIGALEQAILNLCQFTERYANRIDELEINPLKVLQQGKGVVALDVLLKVK